MNISQKLLIIVVLTIIEISFTIWAATEIAKGGTFHQLNFLHVKYNHEFSALLGKAENNNKIDIPKTNEALQIIRQQPVECIAKINVIDKFIMKKIGTYHAYELCKKDIEDVDVAIATLEQYEKGSLSLQQTLQQLNEFSLIFEENSSQFEDPVTKTVSFIMRAIIPTIIFLSIFNIIFITYLSKSITASFKRVTEVLKSSNPDKLSLQTQLNSTANNEISELMMAAKERIESDFINMKNNKVLQKMVDKRTTALLQANEELTQFAYRTSHDLKAPLSTSKMLAKYVVVDIEEGELEEAKENSEKIYNQLDRLEVLVTDILSLAKADVASKIDKMIDFDVLIQKMEERLSWLIDESSCDITVEINVSEVFLSQRIRLSQVIENLIANSLKYADTNKPRQYVKLSVEDDADNIFITVEDNGLGIPEEHQAKVFDMFTRFHPNTSVGSGLGMSIVKKHIDFLGGVITFTSSAQGTTFKITLPRLKKD